MVQSVQVLAIVEVPKHGLGVLATGGAQGAIGRHGHCVQVAGVTNMVGLQLAVGQVPHLKIRQPIKAMSYIRETNSAYLDVSVPATGHDDGVLVVGREPYA